MSTMINALVWAIGKVETKPMASVTSRDDLRVAIKRAEESICQRIEIMRTLSEDRSTVMIHGVDRETLPVLLEALATIRISIPAVASAPRFSIEPEGRSPSDGDRFSNLDLG